MPASETESSFAEAERAAAFIRERTALQPKIAIDLGTGLGGFAERLTDAVAIPYTEIPHFPRPTVEGHAGRLVLGCFTGTPLAVMLGRVHTYEGYTPRQVIYPVRVLSRLGLRTRLLLCKECPSHQPEGTGQASYLNPVLQGLWIQTAFHETVVME